MASSAEETGSSCHAAMKGPGSHVYGSNFYLFWQEIIKFLSQDDLIRAHDSSLQSFLPNLSVLLLFSRFYRIAVTFVLGISCHSSNAFPSSIFFLLIMISVIIIIIYIYINFPNYDSTVVYQLCTYHVTIQLVS